VRGGIFFLNGEGAATIKGAPTYWCKETARRLHGPAFRGICHKQSEDQKANDKM
jgi:hypothetical protein